MAKIARSRLLVIGGTGFIGYHLTLQARKKGWKVTSVSLHKPKIKCPVCKKLSAIAFMPFCSKRCSDIDLMKWLSDEDYTKLDLE